MAQGVAFNETAMSNPIFKLFLSPRGRIARIPFILAMLAWLVFYVGQTFWFKATGINQLNFWLALIFIFLNLHIVFCVSSKRLHDLGRSTWALIAMFAVLLVATIFVMLNFGGLEYFETLHENPEIVNDRAALESVQQTYQQSLAKNLPQTQLILGGIPFLFFLWLAVGKGQTQANRYGDVPTSIKF